MCPDEAVSADIPKLAAEEGEFTFVLLPDTQWYTVAGQFWFEPAKGRPRMTQDGRETFLAQVNWIVRNQRTWNVACVCQVGDLIESHGRDPRELEIASAALSRLELAVRDGLPDGIPYGIAVGNHEQSAPWSSASEATFEFNGVFGIERFRGRSYYGGHFGTDNDNQYHLVTAGDHRFLVIYLECVAGMTPEHETIRWARGLLRKHSDRNGVVVAHYLLSKDLKLSPFGRAIVSGLRDESNLFLMLCGHTESEGHRTMSRPGLPPLHIVMADYAHRSHRDERLGVRAWQGGNGWMQLLRFAPRANKLHVHTYSPTMRDGQFDLQSPHGQFEFDDDSDYTLDIQLH